MSPQIPNKITSSVWNAAFELEGGEGTACISRFNFFRSLWPSPSSTKPWNAERSLHKKLPNEALTFVFFCPCPAHRTTHQSSPSLTFHSTVLSALARSVIFSPSVWPGLPQWSNPVTLIGMAGLLLVRFRCDRIDAQTVHLQIAEKCV